MPLQTMLIYCVERAMLTSHKLIGSIVLTLVAHEIILVCGRVATYITLINPLIVFEHNTIIVITSASRR